MTRLHQYSAASTLLVAGIVVLASCTSEPKPAPKPAPTAESPKLNSTVTTQPGVAGGVSEDSYVVEAIVSEVDLATRRVTLTDSTGVKSSFTAGPEVKNLPQLHVNDKVTATFARRMVVVVRRDDALPSESRSSISGSAKAGEKPGMLVAEETQKVARVTAIDAVKRTADLQFVDGVARRVPVRSDVDLSRYQVGDNVTIRVTTALTVLTESPKP